MNLIFNSNLNTKYNDVNLKLEKTVVTSLVMKISKQQYKIKGLFSQETFIGP